MRFSLHLFSLSSHGLKFWGFGFLWFNLGMAIYGSDGGPRSIAFADAVPPMLAGAVVWFMAVATTGGGFYF